MNKRFRVCSHDQPFLLPGLSRLVVAEAADEKRQPAIVIKGAKGNKRYLGIEGTGH